MAGRSGHRNPKVSELMRAISDYRHGLGLEDVLRAAVGVFGGNDLSSLTALLHRHWFKRRRIIQEATLSRNSIVRSGPYELRWSSFAKALCIIHGVRDQLSQIDELARKFLQTIHATEHIPDTILKTL
jgi:hypothetical protein